MTQESLFELIQEAEEMLLDRCQSEQDQIYYIAKLPSKCIQAIVLAYQNLHPNREDT
jgi:hypothetical protein